MKNKKKRGPGQPPKPINLRKVTLSLRVLPATKVKVMKKGKGSYIDILVNND